MRLTNAARRAYDLLRDMGDVHTGDGIERVPRRQAILAPDGGEGGSVLRALGSKAEDRAKRRKKKKDSYAEYLESATWKKIRAQALKRDKHKCLACGEKAEHVHHVRYPKNLGEEKMEWLYSLCAPCHNAIHKAATKMPLREATDLIIGTKKEGNVTYLPYAGPPRKNRGRWQKKPSRTAKKKKKKQPKKIEPFEIRTGGPPLGTNGSSPPRPGKKKNLVAANDELHTFFKTNRERRERRWGHG